MALIVFVLVGTDNVLVTVPERVSFPFAVR